MSLDSLAVAVGEGGAISDGILWSLMVCDFLHSGQDQFLSTVAKNVAFYQCKIFYNPIRISVLGVQHHKNNSIKSILVSSNFQYMSKFKGHFQKYSQLFCKNIRIGDLYS